MSFIKDNEKEVAKEVLRQCVSCKKIYDRSSLIRVIQKHDTQELIIVLEQEGIKLDGQKQDLKHVFGRSFYLCQSEECREALKKHKRYKQIADALISILKGKNI